jgi:hypothetical protein
LSKYSTDNRDERQRKRRERLRQGNPPNRGAVRVTSCADRQRDEIWRLERQLAEEASQRAAKGSAEASQALAYAKAEIKRLTQELRISRTGILLRSDEIEKLKAKIIKTVPSDPDSEAARRIDALEKKMKRWCPPR